MIWQHIPNVITDWITLSSASTKTPGSLDVVVLRKSEIRRDRALLALSMRSTTGESF